MMPKKLSKPSLYEDDFLNKGLSVQIQRGAGLVHCVILTCFAFLAARLSPWKWIKPIQTLKQNPVWNIVKWYRGYITSKHDKTFMANIMNP